MKFEINPMYLRIVVRGDEDGARDFALPDLQRDFVWDWKQVQSLAGSVLALYPIGSMMLADSIRLGEVRNAACRLDRRTKAMGVDARYVLDGQQRLLALSAAFRPPCGDLKREGKWFRDEKPLRGLWYVDLKAWLDSALQRPQTSEGFDDVDLISSSINRDLDRTVSERDSDDLMEEPGCRVPLWILLQMRGREPELFQNWRTRVRNRLAECCAPHPRLEELLDSLFEHLEAVRLYKVLVIELPEISVQRASSVFRRVNGSGRPLDQADLIFSQLYRWYPTINSDYRQFERRLATTPTTYALAGLRREDLRFMHFLIRGTQSPARNARTIGQILEIFSRKDEADAFRDSFAKVKNPTTLECAADVLSGCGIADRASWPIRETSLALIAAVSVAGAQVDGMQDGVVKGKLRRWWWARTLELAASRARQSWELRSKLFDEAVELIKDRSIPSPPVPTSFKDCVSPIDLCISRKGPAAAGGAHELIMRCLLRCGSLVDLAAGDIPDGSSLDLHHLFPIYWGKQRGINVDVLANLAVALPRTNRGLIGKQSPREYVRAALEGFDQESCERHWSMLQNSHGIDRESFEVEDFNLFIERRAKWFDEQLARIAKT